MELTKSVRIAMVTLEKYTELVFPIIEYCAKMSIRDDFSKDHIWYLNRQIFYGFGPYLSNRIYHSQNALMAFNDLYSDYLAKRKLENKVPKVLTIETLTWADQPIIDKGRKILLFEHMYTGTMFREDVLKHYNSGKEFNIAVIIQLIKDKYSVCLITKNENRELHKTQRGDNPFEYYKKQKIDIVNL
jgi:hypothetical protein